jgi:hypothetical protein
MDKPHRVILDRVVGYADEAAAFLRRRRMSRTPFVRVYWSGGRGADFPAETETGRSMFLAASRLVEVARE